MRLLGFFILCIGVGVVSASKTCSACETSPVTFLYLVRHAQTDWNVQKIIQGQMDIPLNDAGRQEAAQLKEILQPIPFKACFSSDLQRALETAHILCSNRALPIVAEPHLRQRHFGFWQGRPSSEFAGKCCSFLETLNIENDEAMQKRVFSFLKQIAKSYAGSHILIVTHGGIIRAILNHMLESTNDSPFDIHVNNTGVLVIKISEEKWEIQKMQGIEISRTCAA